MQNRQSIWTKILFSTALIFSWLPFIFPMVYRLIDKFTLIFWGITLIVLFIRKSRLKWWLIGLSAWIIIPIYGFLSGTKDYFLGEATFIYTGTPDFEFSNLDKDYRAWNTTTGCVSYGHEPFIKTPNNISIKFWTNFLGYQKGAYCGFYPDKNETFKLIDSLGRKVTFKKEKENCKFEINKKHYKINENKNQMLFEIDNCDSAKVAIVKNQLIIFRPIREGKFFETYLADKETGKIFATYSNM